MFRVSVKLLSVVIVFIVSYCGGYSISRYHQTGYTVIHHYAKIVYYHPDYFSECKLYNVKPNRTYRAFSSYHCQLFDLDGDNYKLNIHGYIAQAELKDTPLQFDVKACKMLNNDLFGFQEIFTHSNFTKCPMKKGCYSVNNYVVADSGLPPFLPENIYLVKFKLYHENLLILQMDWHGEIRKKIN
ncbi:Protein of unknown function (DUF1091) [Popillia japonica]|uniref:MD-2-related lipid-recognition domain-containing protein n=1 Tax=Popillia japonica TaxID=7064 RepID=A0AAW1JTY2_POPJA